jgi:hypothetical protein
MLVIYPTTNYDSLCSLDSANTIITNYFQASQRARWEALDDADKESLLRQSTLLIEQKVGELPSTLEINLQRATAYLANHSIGKDMTNESNTGNVKIKEITGVVKTEFFNPSEDKSNDFPDIVTSLLAVYDIRNSSSFSFNRG